VSTDFATVAVKKLSCLGRSSDSPISKSSVPVYPNLLQHSNQKYFIEIDHCKLTLNDGMTSCPIFRGGDFAWVVSLWDNL